MKMRVKPANPFWCLVLVCLMSSCGYHLGTGSAPWLGSSISIPYVCGDTTGELTDALVREVASSGFQYSENGACYTLCVSILDRGEENIGFRYNTNKQGTLTTTVIPVEGRSRYVAEFSLIEVASGCAVVGPERVSASVEYDHEFDYGNDDLNNLSLGQVSDVEAARDAVPYRIGKVLAQRIVEYLRGAW